MSNSCKQLSALIGDDLILRIISKDSLVDLAPYSITSELRANGGDSSLAATFTVIKDAPDLNGKVFGFTASLARSVIATLTPMTNYGIDYKLSLSGAVQHSERVVIRFERVVTA